MIHEPNENRLPVYFGRDNRLFGWLHSSDAVPPRTPIVICSPVGFEQVRTHRTIRVLAESLAENGHTVLRFDYPSTGDSLDMESDAGHLDAWLDSIQEAVTYVSKASHCDRVSLIGIRLGGILASIVAENQQVGALILWEPPESGKAFCREMQIIASTCQTSKQETTDDGAIDASGFLISAETRKSLRNISLGKNPCLGAPKILLLERDDIRANDCRANALGKHASEVQRLAALDYRKMMLAPQESKLPSETIASIVNWLGKQPHEKTGHSTSVAPNSVTVLKGGVTEQAIQFGPDNRLFGVFTRSRSDKPRPTIITLCGGTVPHYSANRMYVPLARLLAARGYDVLRMSLSGIGDSRSSPGGPANKAYTTTTTDDIKSAMACVTELTGNSVFSLFGLCSGAFAAMQVARTSDQITELILINQLVYFVTDDEFDGLADGSIKSGHALDFPRSETLINRLLIKSLRVFGSAAAWPGQLLQRRLIGGNLSKELQQIAARGIHLAFVYSENDLGQHALLLPARRTVHQLLQSGRATMITVPDTDHTFSPADSQSFLIEWVVQHLEDRHASHNSPDSPEYDGTDLTRENFDSARG